jgi:WD40 repeat protein
MQPKNLKASENGFHQIQKVLQSIQEDMEWPIDSDEWRKYAAKLNNPSWTEDDKYPDGFSLTTWKRFASGKNGHSVAINAKAFKCFCKVLGLNWEDIVEIPPVTTIEQDNNQIYSTVFFQSHDWGESPDITAFYGRIEELKTLEEWIVKDSCRLIAILGMGGIGKTSLSIQIGKKIQDKFEYVIWRSLRNAPSLKELLLDILQIFSNVERQNEINFSDNIQNDLTRLIQYFRQYRCLLILDNTETILVSQNRVGIYRDGYENYEQLLTKIGDLQHQSCLLITSREKFIELAKLEGKTQPVRSLKLNDLATSAAKKLFESEDLSDTEGQIEKIVELYRGNPLALKIVVTTIKELFCGGITEFIKGEEIFLGDIQDILDQQFHRLSNLEQSIMFWLAINRELVGINELYNDIFPQIKRTELMEGLQYLERRSLIEKSSEGFTQQPVVMEYFISKIVDLFSQEIITQKYNLINCYSLIKAQAKDYIRQTQIELILKPLASKLTKNLGSIQQVESALMKCLNNFRANNLLENSYAGGNIINLLSKLNINLSGYNFSNLTIRQADFRDVNLHQVDFSNSNLDNSIFTETFGDVISLAFSSDGKLVAIGTSNGEIRLWYVETGKLLLTYKGHKGWVRCISFSPNNKILVSGGDDTTIRIWSVNSGDNLNILRGHTNRIESVVFTNDYQIASAGDDHKIIIWDIKQYKYLKTLAEHSHLIWSLSFNPSRFLLASGSEDKSIKIWDIETNQCLKTLEEHSGWVMSIDFSPNGFLLASGGQEGIIKIWDIETGQCLRNLKGHSNSVRSICFNQNSSLLASGSSDHTIKIWDIETGQCLRTLEGHSNRVREISFRNDGITLASGSDDQTLKFWNLKTGQIIKTLKGFTNRIWFVNISPNCHLLASGSDEKFIRLWDINTSKCINLFKGHSNGIKGLCFRYDSQLLASSGDDQTIRLWDVQSGQCVDILRGHTSWVGSLDFNSDGTELISGSGDHTLRLWDVSTGKCLFVFEGHTNRVWTVAFNRNGKTIASAGSDEVIRIWDKSTGKQINTLIGHQGWIWSIAFNPRGDILISGSSDHTVKMWNVKTGECINTFKGHQNWIRTVAFSCNGKTIASGSDDQTIKIWDIEYGKCLHTLLGHNDWVKTISFSPDGLILASGSNDETIRLWDVETGKYLKTFRNPRPYEGMNISNISGISEAQKFSLIALGAVEN